MDKNQKKISIDDLPTVDELLKSIIEKNQAMINMGKDQYEVNYEFEKRYNERRIFMLQNFHLLESQDQYLTKRNIKNIVKMFTLALICGAALNKGLSSIGNGRIYNTPFIFRFVTRSALLLAPL